MSRPIEALVNAAALAHNYQLIQQRALGARVFAVVKANGYGHGLQRVIAALPAADGFAILELDAAIAMRASGLQQTILLLEGVFCPDELLDCAQHNLSIAVHSPEHIQWLEQAQLVRPLHVFLKLNTGMNRLGFAAESAAQWVERLSRCANVVDVTLMTHFATADEPAVGINSQWARFCAAAQGLNLPISTANSAAIFAYPETNGDWVRPGIALYGSSPFADRTAESLGLHPVMTLRSEVIAIQELQAGDAVGYGATFLAPHPMRVGVVACGYADGYPRHAPTGTPVVVDGQRSRLVGRVSMDMLCIDLTDCPAARLGSQVELWGSQLSIDDVAKAAGTISYELMCALATRVPVQLV
ncbi:MULTISPECIES: alanine racemase [Deefgea]|uniref:Alanine racemase n=1 Tax=Deefgea chitinilytica TaxID=570276 RepID=A0ABS2C756_9NEIS|nr:MULTISPECIES: alanine racemase [Deefgea]MBM5569984.1 alanine racemase [Deefgea chitinilytica]MBM9887213.1 alanine racemase [Deefgea sp. CFH1-16]